MVRRRRGAALRMARTDAVLDRPPAGPSSRVGASPRSRRLADDRGSLRPEASSSPDAPLDGAGTEASRTMTADDCPHWGGLGHRFRRYDGPERSPSCRCGARPSAPQGSLFDPEAAREARDEAMSRVDGAIDIEEWKPIADRAIEELARRSPAFIVDEVWKILDGWRIPRPREGRAVGPRITEAHKRGLIAPTEDFRPSEQVRSHATPRRVWRSRIYRGGDR